jgi:restriction system protein
MALPDYETLMVPLLRYIAASGEQPIRNAIAALAKQFDLSEQERAAPLPSGRTPIFNSRVHWAATYLVQAGILTRPRRGVLQLTERGKSVLAENPKAIDNEFLARFPEFVQFKERSRASQRQETPAEEPPGSTTITPIEVKQAPDERVELAFSRLL